ncbi:MAG: YybS family protein [Bacillota bacterium]
MRLSFTSRAITEGALGAALTAILGLLGMYVPFFYLISLVAMPLPLALLVMRHNFFTGLTATFIAGAVLLAFLGHPLAVLFLIIQTGPIGLLLGLLLKNRVNFGPAMAVLSLASVLLTLLTLGLTFLLTGLSPLATGEEMSRTMHRALEFYRTSGLISGEAMGELQQVLEQAMRLAMLLLPANLVIWSVVLVYFTYVLAGAVLRRLGHHQIAPPPPLRQWRWPWYVIWVAIFGLGAVLLGDYAGLPWLTAAGQNILYVAGFLYLVIGLSVVSFHLGRRPWPRWVKALLVITALFYWPVFLAALVTLGILDPLFNLRRAGEK